MQYVFWGEKGERSGVYYLLSPSSAASDVYKRQSFFCVLAPEGMNAIVFLGKRRGRSRKIVAYSDTVSAMLSC